MRRAATPRRAHGWASSRPGTEPPAGPRESSRNGEQLEDGLNGLRIERVRSGLLRGRIARRPPSRSEHDPGYRAWPVRLSARRKAQPGRSRHVDVENDHVRPTTPDLPARNHSVFGFVHGYVGNLERRLQQECKAQMSSSAAGSANAVPPFPRTWMLLSAAGSQDLSLQGGRRTSNDENPAAVACLGRSTNTRRSRNRSFDPVFRRRRARATAGTVRSGHPRALPAAPP